MRGRELYSVYYAAMKALDGYALSWDALGTNKRAAWKAAAKVTKVKHPCGNKHCPVGSIAKEK